MRRGWLLVVLAALAGCGKTGLFAPAPGGSGGRGGEDPGGPDGGSAAAGGGDAGAGVGGGGGGGAGGGGGSAGSCEALCCDGAATVGSPADPQECALTAGLDCEVHGGPFTILLDGEQVWQSAVPCPTLRACEVNCCDGEVLPVGPHFDAPLCALAGIKEGACDAHGGPAQVRFDGAPAGQGPVCAGSCQVACCTGRVAYSDQPGQHECEVWAGRMCDASDGGPTLVAHQGTLAWTAGGMCPSVRPCVLLCADGVKETTMRYEMKVCLTEALASVLCASHGGDASVFFDGQEVWQAP